MPDSIRNANCKLCELHKTAKHVCLIGSGPMPSRLMLIGESPGEEEDREGKVFIGKAGKGLDSILLGTNIDRSTIYISNAIKCHPPNNSKPDNETIDICSRTYLSKEILEVQPELIVCLGGLAAKALLQENTVKVGDVRNRIWYTKKPLPSGIPFIITYHPAAVFHQPELLESIVKDMEWSQKLLAGELVAPKKKVDYKKIDNIWMIPNIAQSKWIDLDLETDGLNPFLKNKEILSVQISVDSGIAYYLDWNETVALDLKVLLKSEGIRINGHNIKFDLKWLRVKAGIIFDGKVNDTIQDIHLLDENFPNKSLDNVAANFTELHGHKDQFKKLINMYIKLHKKKKEPITYARSRLWGKAYKTIPINTRIKYGCGDADATGRLRRVFKTKIKEQDLVPLHRLMGNVTKLYVDMECNGAKVNTALVNDLDNVYQKKIRKLITNLDMLSPVTLNHNAPLQLRQLLYGTWKLTNYPIKQGKKIVNYSTGQAAIDQILDDDIPDKIRAYLDNISKFRKIGKLYSTYIKGMPRYLTDDNYIHANWRLDGPETGRTSCNEPNLQQIPRKGDIKQLFISRYGKSGKLLQVDISQGELRIAAHVSNESNLIRLFEMDAYDIHTAVAASIYHKLPEDVTDDERFSAKTVNFLILFGGGARTLAQALNKEAKATKGKTVSIQEASKILHVWNRQFPGWNDYKHETEAFVIDNNYVRNIFGRYRHLFILDPTTSEGQSQLRSAVNSPIQGGLSDYNKLCGYNIWRRIKSNKKLSKALFIMEVHDQYLLDMPEDLIPLVAPIIKEEYENVDTSEFGFKFKVPMRVEIKTGTNWKEMKAYEA